MPIDAAALSWSPDSSEIWFRSFDPDELGTLYAIDLKGHRNAPPALAFSPDGKTLATGGVSPHFNQADHSDSAIYLWNVETGVLR